MRSGSLKNASQPSLRPALEKEMLAKVEVYKAAELPP